MKMGTNVARNPTLSKFFIPPPAKPLVKPQRKDHESHRDFALRSQLEADRRRMQRYNETVSARLRNLRNSVPQVDRYIKLLDRIGPDTTVYSRRDCDQDLADVATRLGLAAIPNSYDRFLLVEYTLAWLADLAKARKVYTLDDADIFGGPPETIDELRSALGLV